jgi:CxxC motif-containing protein (DUF1111 family)
MHVPVTALSGLALATLATAGIAISGEDAGLRERDERGRQLFEQRWVVAPSILGLWGRGPTSNAEACTDCHADYGRGAPPEAPDEPMRSMLLRLSTPGPGVPRPHPVYGVQLQPQGVLGKVPAEGEATVEWIAEIVNLDDGTTVELRRPRVKVRRLAFGELGAETLLSARVAPRLAGLGVLEAIPDADLLALARRDPGDGIRGRVNRVPDRVDGTTRIGRFGLKANEPSIRQQIAVAMHEDLGVTSSVFPHENCPPVQLACTRQPSIPRPELSDQQLDDLASHLRVLAPPARRETADTAVARGETLFTTINCSACHVPRIGAIGVQPFTDLLVHDLGDGLADHRPDFDAGPRDWRTAPLWGLGQAAFGDTRLLHDGRARSVEEAILWHGGEAEAAKGRYARLPREDREALIRFLSTL